MANQPPTVSVSQRFSAQTPTTVAFQSRDGEVFHVERDKLERASDFAPPSGVTSSSSEKISLDEDAATLELLFRFVYFDIPINLAALSLLLVDDLAEAAHKYAVHTAIVACHAYMLYTAQDHPTTAMKFAARHNYTDILDAAAPCAIGTDLKTMKEILPTSLILPWVTYNDAYNQIAQGLPRMLSQEANVDEESPNAHYDGYHDTYDGYHDTYDACKLGDKRTEIWRSIQRDIALAVVDGGAQNLRDLDRIFSLDLFQRVAACDWCHSTLSGYKFNVAQQMKELRSQHPFSSYVQFPGEPRNHPQDGEISRRESGACDNFYQMGNCHFGNKGKILPHRDPMQNLTMGKDFWSITGMDPGEDPRVDALRRRNEALAKEKEAIEVDKEALRIELQRAVDAKARAEAEAAEAKDHVAEARSRATTALRELIIAKDEMRQLRSQVRRLQDDAEATQKELLRSQRRARRLFERLEQARAVLCAGDDDDESDGNGDIDVQMQDFKVEQKPDAPPTLTPPPDTQMLPSAAAHVEARPEGAEAAVPLPANASLSLPVSTDRAEDSPMVPAQPPAPESYTSASALFSIQTSRAIALPSLLGVHPPQQASSENATEPSEDASTGKKRKWTTTIMKTWVGTNPSTTAPDLEVRDPRARARLERKKELKKQREESYILPDSCVPQASIRPPLRARLEALVCRNKVLAQEKEALEVAIATLYIELRHAKAARTQAETIAARAHERAAAVNQREAKMNAAFSASTHEMCLLRQDMCRLRDELQTSQQETFKAYQDAQYLRAQSAEPALRLINLRGPAKPFPGKDERVLREKGPPPSNLGSATKGRHRSSST
ncbi:hypothetical protein GGG16DRAFT_106138 [Schizophyllum commune]